MDKKISLKDRRLAEKEKKAQARKSFEEKYMVTCLSEGVCDLLWNKAWEDGHASGFHEVEMLYEDLAEIAKSSFRLGREQSE